MFGPPQHSDRRARLAFLLAALAVLGASAACGEDVLVGRWTLTADLPDAAPGAPDAGPDPDSSQAESADRARRRAEQEAKEQQNSHNDH
jgi:hypothetical protein